MSSKYNDFISLCFDSGPRAKIPTGIFCPLLFVERHQQASEWRHSSHRASPMHLHYLWGMFYLWNWLVLNFIFLVNDYVISINFPNRTESPSKKSLGFYKRKITTFTKIYLSNPTGKSVFSLFISHQLFFKNKLNSSFLLCFKKKKPYQNKPGRSFA